MNLKTKLEEMRKRCEAATKTFGIGDTLIGDTGHWATVRGLPTHSAYLANYLKIEDATFIAAARTDMPALIEALEVALEGLQEYDNKYSLTWAKKAIVKIDAILLGEGK